MFKRHIFHFLKERARIYHLKSTLSISPSDTLNLFWNDVSFPNEKYI